MHMCGRGGDSTSVECLFSTTITFRLNARAYVRRRQRRVKIGRVFVVDDPLAIAPASSDDSSGDRPICCNTAPVTSFV